MHKNSILIAATLAASLTFITNAQAARPGVVPDSSCATLGLCPPEAAPPGIRPIDPPVDPGFIRPGHDGPSIRIDLGGRIGRGGVDYDDDYGISCRQGRSIVRHSGFRRVHVIECRGDVFTYSGKKRGMRFTVGVNMDGEIVGVTRPTY